ncbi:DEAD/DEAH box helicase [Vibrio sp. 03-59-1]|uniref:DEAD/DEAH box helicase n=1 Tax=Vibrio TaxID=662 RepID=UPI0014935057|nr:MULTISPECIES: DEAD/DEAH box helicase [Vibrio]MDN3696259.1 DEAD/DEAH box helicase [Vibrio cortegadensis]NOH85412.1 DEAD/DEAH box helicase [Vibrio sp. 03-59-1]
MSDTTLTFDQLGLSKSILATLAKLNFSQPTSVQERAIPHVLAGKDVLAGAQTGTGKTAAFGFPIIQRLSQNPIDRESHSKVVRSLILVPTRELAQQVFDNLESYAEGSDVKVVVAYGGTSMHVQTKNLRGGADILVATPGRLIDHLFVKNIVLNQTETLVLDEADRMLDMGFMPDIQRILRRMNDERQTLFFSATFDKKIKKIAHDMMRDPTEIQVTPSNSTADKVKQLVFPVDKKRKSELLAYLIGSRNWQQVLVFTKTKQGTDVLVKELKLDGIKAASIHGDKSQGARQKALDDFKSGKVRALIATDVAARGLDIQQLEQVVNFELPYKAEDYVHRIGRTGRAGNEGLAVSLMSRDEEYLLEAVETLLDTRLPQEWLAGFEPSLLGDVEEDRTPHKKGRSADKRKMKAKLKIHQNRGKAKR